MKNVAKDLLGKYFIKIVPLGLLVVQKCLLDSASMYLIGMQEPHGNLKLSANWFLKLTSHGALFMVSRSTKKLFSIDCAKIFLFSISF